MSDYMFMLESRLNRAQLHAFHVIQEAANTAGIPLFLTGAGLRDMLGGYPIRDLEFTIEGNPASFVKGLVKKQEAEIVGSDSRRNVFDVRFATGGTVHIGMARQETYDAPASDPIVRPGTIHEDLMSRDFTINAIAMSLNRQSRALLVDPSNGMGDLENRELRHVGRYTLYDDPSRIFRLFRYRVRMGFTVSEKTQNQYRNVREAHLEEKIPAEALGRELRNIANETGSADIVKLLDDEKLLSLFCPALTGAKVNHVGLQKLQKVWQSIPLELHFTADNLPLFLTVLAEDLTVRERQLLAKTCALSKKDIAAWQKLEESAAALEQELKAPSLSRASRVYAAASQGSGEQILYLIYKSESRLVQDRLRNYVQKYLMVEHELSDEELAEAGIEMGSPKYDKARRSYLFKKLDARPKKIPAESDLIAPAPGGAEAGARRL